MGHRFLSLSIRKDCTGKDCLSPQASVRRLTAWILSVFLGLALFMPSAAHAGANSGLRMAHANPGNKYLKHQRKMAKKAQRKTRKSQKSAQKSLKYHHQTGR
jgi:hypothetical protein